MITAINRKTLGNMGNGFMKGGGIALNQIRRVQLRTPWTLRTPMGSFMRRRPKLSGFMILSSIAALIGGLLYFRKRKEIAERYTMGRGEGPDSWGSRRDNAG
jgi:hypothetical protein